MNRLLKRLLSLFFVVFFLSSCISSPNNIATTIPIDSFILIKENIEYQVCNTLNDRCGKMEGLWSASGVLVAKSKKKKNAHILTAGHVCDEPKMHPSIVVVAKKSSMDGYTTEGKKHIGKIVAKSTRYDLCLVEIDYVRNKVAKLARREPKRGERIWNTAAPVGIWYPNTIVILEGIYDGERGSDMVMSLPAAPGSSGSPIYNKHGRIIGILHSVNSRFDNVSYATRLRYIKRFLRKSRSKIEADRRQEKADETDSNMDVEIF